MPDLDADLHRSRAQLLGEIDQPPIAAVRRRAGALRRRRRAAVAGSALAVLLAAGVAGLQPWERRDGGVDPATGPTPAASGSAPTYTGAGITINGLQPKLLVDLPGQITDVEFVDPDHGYVVSQCPTGPVCTAVSVTEDDGETFSEAALPDAARSRELQVVAFPRGQALLVAGSATFATADEGRTWQPTPPAGGS